MKTSHPLYSFVLLHYLQKEYIFQALDSILKQTYPRLELVVIDDGSENYNEQEISQYIEAHKNTNLERVILLQNNTNLGTTASLNKAIHSVTGEFLHFFAADDEMADEYVAENFIHKFNELGSEVQIISAMARMYDYKMEIFETDFTPPALQKNYNTLNASEQFNLSARRCIFPIGACCMRTAFVEKMGFFDERYRLVEDWAFFLKILRSGEKVYTDLFPALHHRAGGVSHSILEDEAPHDLQYREDILVITENEILPYMNKLPLSTQQVVYRHYVDDSRVYIKRGGTHRIIPRHRILFQNKPLWFRRVLDTCVIKSSWWLRQAVNTTYKTLLAFVAVTFVLDLRPVFLPNFMHFIFQAVGFILFLVLGISCIWLIVAGLISLLVKLKKWRRGE